MPTQVAPDPVRKHLPAQQQANVSARTSGLALRRMAAGVLLLAGAHVLLQIIWPGLTGQQLGSVLNLAWFVSNLFLLGSLAHETFAAGRREWRTWVIAGVGYAVMLWLLWPLIRVLEENLLLLVLAVMLYGGLVRHPFLCGYLFLFLVCQRFLPAYLYPSFFLGALLYSTLPPFLRAWREQRQWFLPLCHLAGLMLLTGLLLPVAFYVLQGSAQDLHRELREPEVISAMTVSLRTSALATLVVLILGVPLAYAIVRVAFPGRALIDTLIDLPIVVPSPIAGIMLLAFTGPRSPLGMWLEARWGVRLLDTEGAIVLAQIFVSSPFLIRAAMIAFGAIDVRYEHVARTLGARPTGAFVRITLPLALPGILIGTMLTWFRAVAEFGSLRFVANTPYTMPMLSYNRFLGYSQSEAHSIGVLVLLMSLGVIAGMWIIRILPVVIRRSVGGVDAAR